VRVGDVDLCFETFGDPGDPAVMLIMGLGMQMRAWPDDLCRLIADEGHYVVRFDNRDCGGSTHYDRVPPPSLGALVTRRIRRPAYTLGDLADDAAGLLDQLGIGSAHVVGASMGAMIGQVLAARHPRRVLTLTSIMGSTGSLRSGQPSPRLYSRLMRPTPNRRDRYVEHLIRLFGVVGSPGFVTDENELREQFETNFDRGASPDGTLRQLAAILAAGDRTAALRTITAPTLVIHGKADRLVPPSGGWATARAVPDARMLLIDGMGHDLPRQLWHRLADAIVEHVRRVPTAGTPRLGGHARAHGLAPSEA
jgi:pimeloyl-ACP methyl ester carboxylesterase